MKFVIDARENKARAGKFQTDHGEVPTPAFMPVGTVGSVKTLESQELENYGASISLSNAYHLYLRPGTENLVKLGGLHKFMAWEKPILVDSGGFQVFSLTEIRKVTEEGVKFRSHIDGSYHLFTPEKVIEIQRAIGADLVMPLDELVGWPVDEKTADEAAKRTWRWLERGIEAFENSQPVYGHDQYLMPIVQGSFFPEFRRREAEQLAQLEKPAYAIGGLAVGEDPGIRAEMIDLSVDILPSDSLKYTMGIGFPEDILSAIGQGIDLFDCVVPTRNGRNATLFTPEGRLNMRNAKYECDEKPVEEGCLCPCCSQYTRAYIHHLYRAKEILALKLGTAHNLSFYFHLVKQAQEHIIKGDFYEWSSSLIEKWKR